VELRTGVERGIGVELFSLLAQARARWNVLEHPFYLRWSSGTLTRPELALYAGQYRHAVVALAHASTSVALADASARAAAGDGGSASRELAAHAVEEASHVGLWDGFARAVGAEPDAPPEPETADCVAAWARPERPPLETLVALYAIESAQPAIAAAKGDGLRARYGIDAPEATAYFDVHAERDRAHAATGRALIEARLDGAGAGALAGEGEAVLRANWRLLDGVERICAGG
jgi:pyrroloquinoline-quinone synthase